MTSRTLKCVLLASTILVLPTAAIQAQEAGAPASPPASQSPEIEEFLVQGEFIPDEKRATSEIANVLDQSDFQITGDSDIAGALQRMPGISLVGGKFVFVRGLGERYSSVVLDGASLPSPEPLRRVVPLDIFPTSLLEGALVQKTYSPKYPLEFGGGVLDLRTRALPDEGFFSAKITGGFNSESTFKKGLSYDGRGMDFTGFDNSLRTIPKIIAENYPLNQLSPADLEKAGQALPNIWTLDSEPNPMNVDLEIAAGDRFELGEKNLGIIASVRYSSEFQNQFGTRNRYVTSDAGPVINQQLDPAACDNYEGATGCGYFVTDWTIGLNGIFSAGLELDSDNTIKYTTLMLRKTDRIGERQQGEFSSSPGVLRSRAGIDWIEQQLWTNQLSGEHFINYSNDMEPLTLNWHLAYSMADREVKLRRDYLYVYDEINKVYRNSTTSEGNHTYFGGLDDNILDTGFDFDQPVTLAGIEVNVKGGFTYVDKERDSAFRRFYFKYPNVGGLNELRTRIPEIIFGSTNVDPNGFVLTESTESSDFWSASMTNYQGFGQLDVQLTPSIRVAAGGRYENSEQIVNTVDRQSGNPLRTTLKGEYLLPSVTGTYEFADNMQLRAAFSQTISRPDFRELSPAEFLDEERRQTRGQQIYLDSNTGAIDLTKSNPLKITEIDNYDVRLEWYFGTNESITVGAFYKDFTNPIEWTYFPRGEGIIREPRNALGAKLKGVEAELEAILPALNKRSKWEWWQRKDVFLKINGALIDSNIELAAGVATDTKRSLQGQSDSLLNVQLGFDDPVTGEHFAILYNFTGPRIDDVALFGAPNFVERPPRMLNLTYARTIHMNGGDYEVSFEAENLLNDDYVVKQGNFVAEQYDIGMTFKLGLKVSY
jgi:outer membrane receptor protein involved in Fe transport